MFFLFKNKVIEFSNFSYFTSKLFVLLLLLFIEPNDYVFAFYFFIRDEFFSLSLFCQTKQPDVWEVHAKNIQANDYYGITSANGMIGIVSSQEPLKIKEVILGGTYDSYGRGRVSNFIRGFNFLNAQIQIDGAFDMKKYMDLRSR